MSIKVTLGEKPKEEKPFPKLMICKDDDSTTIVCFIRPEIGIQVYSDYKENSSLQMKETDKWNMNDFADYNEPITLQNA